MAETKKTTKKAAAPAAKKPAAAKAAAEQPKAAPKKAAVKAAAPVKVKKAVARPVTRAVVKKAAPAPAPKVKAQRAPRVAPKPLPTAPAGQVPLIAADGSVAGAIALPQTLRVEVDPTVVFQAVVAAQANARQGTAATRNRSRVRGGGAKPWRQKGTGRARQGSTRAPHWRHGGVVFGPNGRTYDQRLARRLRRSALGASFGERAAEGRVLVLEELRLPGESGRSRDLVDLLARVGDVRRAVIVTAAADESVARAAANIEGVEVRTPNSLRLIDVLHADTLVVVRGALDALAARAASAKEAA